MRNTSSTLDPCVTAHISWLTTHEILAMLWWQQCYYLPF